MNKDCPKLTAAKEKAQRAFAKCPDSWNIDLQRCKTSGEIQYENICGGSHPDPVCGESDDTDDSAKEAKEESKTALKSCTDTGMSRKDCLQMAEDGLAN